MEVFLPIQEYPSTITLASSHLKQNFLYFRPQPLTISVQATRVVPSSCPAGQLSQVNLSRSPAITGQPVQLASYHRSTCPAITGQSVRLSSLPATTGAPVRLSSLSATIGQPVQLSQVNLSSYHRSTCLACQLSQVNPHCCQIKFYAQIPVLSLLSISTAGLAVAVPVSSTNVQLALWLHWTEAWAPHYLLV